MSSYRIIEHKIPCQHLREYPRALAFDEEEIVHLAVKQYIPIDNPNPRPGDVTIIAAHANGFPKELYEPYWDELMRITKKYGFKIRSIWMSDVSHQGASGVLNESRLGNDPAWFDHSRDLLHLINLKRDQMPRPIVGIGHSMGGAQLVNLALFHPSLFTTFVLLDPVIQPRTAEIKAGAPPNIAQLSTFRRDVWSSREAALESYKKSAFYKTWDPRVLDRWVQYGLRELPTALHPSESSPKVTLTTPISHEVFTFLRPNYEGHGSHGKPVNRKTHADLNPALPVLSPFYRYEGPYTFSRIHELRPSVFYIFADQTNASNPEFDNLKLNTTGTGVGGSGGAKDGRVKSVTLKGVGHLIPMEAVQDTARYTAEWLGSELQIWRQDRELRDREWTHGKSLREKQDLDERWVKAMGGRPSRTPSKDSRL